MDKSTYLYPQWFEKLTQGLDKIATHNLWNQYDKLRAEDPVFVSDVSRFVNRKVTPVEATTGRGWPGNVLPKEWLSELDAALATKPTSYRYGLTPGQVGVDIKPIDVKPSNPKDRAASNRLDISLFPMTAIVAGALAMVEGDCKYGGYNYREMGVCVSTYISALDRHKMKFYNGEWQDTKTWVAHLGSMIASCAILIDGFAKGNIVDDRPPRLDVTALLDEAEEKVTHLHEIFPNGPARYTEVKNEQKS